MYSIYNKKWDYAYLLSNRVATNTQRRFYAEIHRDEFTEEEYRLLESTSSFNPELSHKFPKYEGGNCKKIFLSRNPYTRSLSIYSLYIDRTSHYSDGIKTQSEDFYNKNKDTDFLTFLKYVNTERIWDTHIFPQSYDYEKYCNNITLGKLEYPKETLYDFYESIEGFDMNKVKKSFNNIFSVKLFKSNLELKIQDLLTDEIESYIYNFYKKDFHLFGYERYNFVD